MNNIRPVIFKSYKGLRPEFMSEGRKTFVYTWSSSWFKTTNWSRDIKRQIDGPDARDDGYWNRGTELFRSGGTALKSHKGCVMVNDTNRILILVVRDPMNRRMVLVNSGFDTPKVPRDIKPLRSHWRKWMYDLVNRGTMVVKVDDDFLSNFKDRYNYAPSEYTRSKLQPMAIELVKRHYNIST